MSLKRVVLIAVLALLVMPAAVFADGITFGMTGATSATFSAGKLDVFRPFTVGSTASTSGLITLTYLSRMTGPVPFGPTGPPTFGTPPSITFPGTPNTNDFGSVTFTTGALTSFVGLTSATFGAGGSFVITSGGTLGTATGGAIPNGTTLFSGSFSGPTALTQLTGGGFTRCQPTVTYCYQLSGPISGALDASVLSYFGLGEDPGAQGLFLSIAVGFNDNNPLVAGQLDSQGQIEGGMASVVVPFPPPTVPIPEPGTLALFGTGLAGLAVWVRRRLTPDKLRESITESESASR
jgi:hypothetical protein